MRRLMSLALSLLLLCALISCGTPDTTESGYGLWYPVDPDSDRSDSAAVRQEGRNWAGQPDAQALLQALLDGPHTSDLYSPFPEGASIHFVSVNPERQTVWVDMNGEYGNLKGYDLTLADYCIALTLGQLPEVEYIRVTVEGESISGRNRQTMRVGDVLLSGTEEEPDTFLAALYFPDRSGGALVAEYRQVSRGEGQDAAEIVMAELLRGPQTSEGCLPMPEGTRVRSLAVRDRICYVDLSREFADNAPTEVSEAGLTLFALVNTLCIRSGISRVQLLIEGERVEYYGNISVDRPLSANFDLVAN